MEYNIVLKSYEGPMDLLLDLIKKNKIDIYDIPIFKITEEFLQYLENAAILNMELTSDFTLMASTLLEIKSKMLLPKPPENENEELEDPRADLVRNLLEYKRYKEATDILKKQEEYESKSFVKLKTEIFEMNELDFLKNTDVNKLSQVLIKILQNYKKDEIIEIERDNFKVEDASRIIKTKIINKKRILFTELLENINSKIDIITYFLGMLELIKLEFVVANQKNNYGDILIEIRTNY